MTTDLETPAKNRGASARTLALGLIAAAVFLGAGRHEPARIAALAAGFLAAFLMRRSPRAASAIACAAVLLQALDYALHPAPNSARFGYGLLAAASLAVFLLLLGWWRGSRIARAAARLALVLASLGAAAVAGEWAALRFLPSVLHLVAPVPDSPSRELYRPDPELVHVHAPGFRGRFVHPEYGGERFEVNAEGWRDLPWPDPMPEGEERVLLLGDSMAVGYGVEREETIAAEIESRLRARRPGSAVRVLNAGVAGYGPRHEAAALRRLLPRVRPDRVVVLFFDGNDLDDCRRHLRRTRGPAFVGGQAPPDDRALPEGGDPDAEAAEAEFRAATLFEPLYWFRHSALFRVVGAGVVARLARFGVRPPRYYYAYYEYKMLSAMRREPEPWVAEEHALAIDALREMDAACAAAGARLLVVRLPASVQTVIPTFESWHADAGRDPGIYDRTLPGRRIVEACAALGIRALDLLPRLEIARPVPSPWYWQEGHPNRAGNRAIAGWIVEDFE